MHQLPNGILLIRNGRETGVPGSCIVIMIEGPKKTDSNILDIEANNPIFIDNLSAKLLAKTNKYYIPPNSPPHYKT